MRDRWCSWILIFGAIAGTAAAQPSGNPAVERLGEEAYAALAAIYSYDSTIPLEARTVEKVEGEEGVREKIVFRGVQGFLAPAYLQLPTKAEQPLACVLLLHGWSGSKESWWQDDNYISGGNVRRKLLDSGFAVLAMDAQCHGDRDSLNDYAPVNHYVDPTSSQPRKGYFTQQEIYIQTTRDYRRAIDYLETRAEIDAQRIGIVGYSMGGTQTFLLTGVEPRIKVAVAVATPAEGSKLSPIAPQNFVRAFGDRPFLTIGGTSDSMCSPEHSRKRFALIPSNRKEERYFDAGHRLPADYVPFAIDWIRRFL